MMRSIQSSFHISLPFVKGSFQYNLHEPFYNQSKLTSGCNCIVCHNLWLVINCVQHTWNYFQHMSWRSWNSSRDPLIMARQLDWSAKAGRWWIFQKKITHPELQFFELGSFDVKNCKGSSSPHWSVKGCISVLH